MKYTYRRVFTDPNVLLEMLKLRASGKSYVYLAKKYVVDHSSIIYQCEKYGVKRYESLKGGIKKEIKKKNTSIVYPDIIVLRERPVKHKEKYANLIFEKINQGRNYLTI